MKLNYLGWEIKWNGVKWVGYQRGLWLCEKHLSWVINDIDLLEEELCEVPFA